MSKYLELLLSVLSSLGLTRAGGAGSRRFKVMANGLEGEMGSGAGIAPGNWPRQSLLLPLQPFSPSLSHPGCWDQPFQSSTLFCTVSGGLSADLLQM